MDAAGRFGVGLADKGRASALEEVCLRWDKFFTAIDESNQHYLAKEEVTEIFDSRVKTSSPNMQSDPLLKSIQGI